MTHIQQLKERKIAIKLTNKIHVGRLNKIYIKAVEKSSGGWGGISGAYYYIGQDGEMHHSFYLPEGMTAVNIEDFEEEEEEKEILGYRLKDEKYRAAAEAIAKIRNSLGDWSFGSNSFSHNSFVKAGVMHWFEPVYKEPAVMAYSLGHYAVRVDRREKKIIAEDNGCIEEYPIEFLKRLYESLRSTKYIHSINIGCQGEQKVTKEQLAELIALLEK